MVDWFTQTDMSSLKLMSIESVMPFSQFILCHPLLLLPSIFPSIRVFSNESSLRIRWLKYWSFSFSISPSNEYSGLISFRIDASRFFFYRVFYSMLLMNLILKRFTTLVELNWFPTKFPVTLHACMLSHSIMSDSL